MEYDVIHIIPITLLALATWRTAFMLFEEEGPFDIFIRFRERLGITHDDGLPSEYPSGFVGDLFSCIYCLSVWVGIGFTILFAFSPEIAFWISLPLALSTMAIVIHSVLQ